MIKTKQSITSINGFNIGDKVRLKDGDGREHIIKSFSIEGLNEFFFEVQFEDESWAMLDNIELLSSDLDEAAEEYANMGISSNADPYEETMAYQANKNAFKAGAKWIAQLRLLTQEIN